MTRTRVCLASLVIMTVGLCCGCDKPDPLTRMLFSSLGVQITDARPPAGRRYALLGSVKMAAMDTDGDGVITKNEMIAKAMDLDRSIVAGDAEWQANAAFRIADKNHDAQLDEREWPTAIDLLLTCTSWVAQLHKRDANHDGWITRDEFLAGEKFAREGPKAALFTTVLNAFFTFVLNWADQDGDGRLTRDELAAGCLPKEGDPPAPARSLAKSHD